MNRPLKISALRILVPRPPRMALQVCLCLPDGSSHEMSSASHPPGEEGGGLAGILEEVPEIRR